MDLSTKQGIMKLTVSQLRIWASLAGGASSGIVRDLSFCAQCGKKLAVVGESGCGKTMTAMAILGLLPDNCRAQGSIRWGESDLLSLSGKQRRALLGSEHVLIPQSGADFLNPSLTVKRQMSEALARIGVPKKHRAERMLALLKSVGFANPDGVLRSYPFQLSGGMAQRVVMAMASAGQPKLVIADEPTKGIDQDNTAQFIGNLDSLFGDAAVILITHDISVAAVCDDILIMKDGTAAEYGDAQTVLSNPQSEYTRQLIADLPPPVKTKGGAPDAGC